MLATQQIFLVAALLCFLTFLILLSVASEKVRGVRELLLASMLGVAGNTLYAFGRELPPLLAYEGANVAYAAASAALVAGFRNLAGLRARALPLMAGAAGLGVLIALFHYVNDSFIARSVVVSLFQAAVCAEIARTVLFARVTWQRPFYTHWFVIGMCALVAGGHLGRIAWVTLAAKAPTSLLQLNTWTISFLIAVSVALPALAFGGLLLAYRQIVMRAEHVGNHDFLTGAASRKAFFDIAALAMVRAHRRNEPLALLLVDMDNFKAINDRWGHQAGDAALLRLVAGARATLRAADCVARLGGDEFALLLPDTDLHGATAAAAKLQQAVRHAHADRDAAPTLTLSIGITLITHDEDLASAMNRADEALYAAKLAGRDRVSAKTRAVLELVRYRA
jgi:diguanylate cyclase (GGDEF)-like protein